MLPVWGLNFENHWWGEDTRREFSRSGQSEANSAQDSPPRAALCTNFGKVHVDTHFVFSRLWTSGIWVWMAHNSLICGVLSPVVYAWPSHSFIFNNIINTNQNKSQDLERNLHLTSSYLPSFLPPNIWINQLSIFLLLFFFYSIIKFVNCGTVIQWNTE